MKKIIFIVAILVSAAITYLLNMTFGVTDRCLDQGGRWNEAQQECEK